ncbi:uncharacterized protein LOC129659367 isoform X16 [Bubalus kerabau]|uniref:uncharacterized protein LOC129659367 isoform X16 n=1 Tax=Bubalus carabanensis TaxID=3119969 RepID=UPI00244E9D0D|nr:uncharacterized protein LOC129659367 isoform X16 [Bubalus carabanensis]
MHSLPLCCPGKTVYSYLISQWDILLEDRGQHLEAVRRRITHAGGIQQPCADDADAACGEEPEDSSQQLAQGASLMAQAVKNLPVMQEMRCRFHPWVGKIPLRRKWQPTPVFLPGESHG